MKFITLLVLWMIPAFVIAQRNTRIDSLLLELPQTSEDTLKVKLLEDLAFAYSPNHPKQAIKYARNATALAGQLNFPKWIASSNAILAISYEANNDYDKAIAHNKKALSIYKKIKRATSCAAIYSNLSVIYLDQSNIPEALGNAFEALKIYEELGHLKNVGVVSENIGHIYFQQKNYIKTRSYYDRAFDNFKKSGTETDMARCIGNIARLLQAEGKNQLALEYLFKALESNKRMDNMHSVQINLANIGNVYYHLKNYAKAIEYHRKALDLSEKLGSQSSIGINSGNLGTTYLDIYKAGGLSAPLAGHLKLAISYLQHAVSTCEKIKFTAPLPEFTNSLKEAYLLSGNYQKAFEVLEKHTALTNLAHSQKSDIDIANLENRREIALRDKDIIIKNKQLEIIHLQSNIQQVIFVVSILICLSIIYVVVRNYKKRARSQRNMMDKIIKIQSHEIRGPVATILGLANLLNTETPEDPENKEVVQGIIVIANHLDDVVQKVIKDSE